MTETRETDNGTEVAANSGWSVNRNRDRLAGDRSDDDITIEVHGEPTRLVQLPTEPADDRDPGVPPACSFCNADQQTAEREGEALRTAVGDGERAEVRYERHHRPHFGVVEAIDTRHDGGWRLVVSPFTDAGTHVVDAGEAEIVTAPFDDDEGVIHADYAILGEESDEIKAFACHACVQR